MVTFIRIVVEGTETLVNLANVVSIQFWEEGEYRRPYAAIVTTGSAAPGHGRDPAIPHTITVQDEGPIAALRAELRRAGVLPPQFAPYPADDDGDEDVGTRPTEVDAPPADDQAHENEPPPAIRDSVVVDETMPATGRKFDRSRPPRGYNQPE